MSLIETFLTRVDERPEAPAIITAKGEIVTYAQLSRRSAARARAFTAQGMGEGDVALVAMRVGPALYETLLALFRLRAAAMFPEPAAGVMGVRAAIRAAAPKAMIASLALGATLKAFVPELRRTPWLDPSRDGGGPDPLAAGAPDVTALLTFTSGSTGAPKGIARSAAFLLLQHALLERIRRTSPNDVDLISLPVFILSNLAAGAASVLPDGDLRRPAALDGARLARQITDSRVNRIIAPPSICARLAATPHALSPVNAVFTGGGPVFPNLLRDLRACAPNAAICAVYGSTEAEPIAHVAVDQIDDEDWRAMSEGAGLLAGRPIPEATLAFVDDEIEVAGPHVNPTYVDPTQNSGVKMLRDGRIWHRTGDAGRLDAQGRLWLLGRRAAAAEGLYPFAVETAALSWPKVRQAALLAEDGEALLALAGDGLDPADLARRAATLGPIRVIVVAEVPLDRRHNSKVDYARLRALLR
jgi:acyl-coenzyme A synthetase/AMP-(fatty) acid ligase